MSCFSKEATFETKKENVVGSWLMAYELRDYGATVLRRYGATALRARIRVHRLRFRGQNLLDSTPFIPFITLYLI